MNTRFIGKSGGVVHVVHTKVYDLKNSKCSTLKKYHEEGSLRGKGISPEAALALPGCSRCKTHEVAEVEHFARMTPAQKRAARKQVADDTLEKLRVGKPSKKAKPPAAERQRRGPKGGDVNASMQLKVEDAAKFAEKHDWVAKAWNSGANEWTCEATRDGETLKIIYRDGRTVWSRVVLQSGVEVRLRNSSNWRKQAEGSSKFKSDYQPKSRGKKAAKAAVIDDSAPRKLPFNVDEDNDTIIESLLGKTVTWRNSISRRLEVATVPQRSRNCRIVDHPKSGRKMLSFYESQGVGERGELLGGERTVMLDKILKVKG